MRLVADAMLGRLAKWLRVLGYDTLYWRGDDAGLVRLAVAEHRLVLTRDTRLSPRLPPSQCLFIESDHYDKQLRQVIDRLGWPTRTGHRCLRCNLLLEAADKAELRDRVPEFVWLRHDKFARCPGCLRIYWEGTHFQRMTEVVHLLCA
jgi:uncharacterized protein with PIN domain